MVRLNRKQEKKYTVSIICLICMLLTVNMKWLFEGILDKSIIEATILLFLLCILLFFNRFKIKKIGLIWILYIINIIFSLIIHPSSFGIWGRGAITVFTVAFIFFVDEPIYRYKTVLKLFIFFGIVNSALVFCHYFFESFFDNTYYSLLNETARGSYSLYSKYGYFFGLLYNPHEPAFMICISIAGIVLWDVMNKTRILCYTPVLVLFVSLLMTGKRGIFVIGALSLIIMILVLYGSRKQWLQSLLLILFVVIGLAVFIQFVLTYTEIEFFTRFRTLILGLFSGDGVDSGRFQIYDMAFNEWKSNPILGIGWRHFNALTVEKYHMKQYHEVNCDYLQWLCETGIVGFLCNIITIGVMQFRAMFVCRNLIKRIDNTVEKWILLLTGYIQIFVLVYAFIEIPFEDIIIFAIYIISCIVQNSLYRRRSQFNEERG